MSEPLSKAYPIRFTEAEREALDLEAHRQYGAARKGGQLVRRYVQEGLARDRGEVRESPSFDTYKRLTDELSALRIELSRVGGNLNQIAHAVNLHDVVDGRRLDETHQELRDQFSRLAALVKEVSRGLLHR